MKKVLFNVVVTLAILGTLGLIGFIAKLHFDAKAVADRNAAIDQCGQMARVTYKTADGAEVSQPEEIWYSKCLSEKKLH